MQKYPFILVRDFSLISCKYLHFMCFVENLRTSLRKIYGHGVSSLYKSLYKIFEQINEKFHAGINEYFCIKKILHFNENAHSNLIYHIQVVYEKVYRYYKFLVIISLEFALLFLIIILKFLEFV